MSKIKNFTFVFLNLFPFISWIYLGVYWLPQLKKIAEKNASKIDFLLKKIDIVEESSKVVPEEVEVSSTILDMLFVHYPPELAQFYVGFLGTLIMYVVLGLHIFSGTIMDDKNSKKS